MNQFGGIVDRSFGQQPPIINQEEIGDDVVSFWQRNPVWWIENFLGVKLWDLQAKIAQAIADYDRVAVASAHDLGKSFLAACITIWFFYCFPDAKVTTTAPTHRQVESILWTEIGKLHRRLEGVIYPIAEKLTTRLRMKDEYGRTYEEWYAYGFSSENPDAFQGSHAVNQLVIVDEACGVEASIYEAIEGVATAEGNKILQIGNPTNPNTYFGKSHSGKYPGWKTFSMSAFDSPNVYYDDDTGEWKTHDPLPYPGLVTTKFIEQSARQYGTRSSFYKARVLGVFPMSASDQLIDGRHLAAAVDRGIMLRKAYMTMIKGDEIIDPDLFN